MSEEMISAKRIRRLLVLLLASMLLPVICGSIRGIRLDHMVVWCFFSLLCHPCMMLYVLHVRLSDSGDIDISNDYAMITFLYLVCLLAACLMTFLPEFAAPVMALSALCNGAFRSKLGVMLGVYFSLLTALFSEGGEFVASAYVLLALLGVILTELFFQKQLRMWTGILTISLSAVIPVCFNYLSEHSLDVLILLYTLLGSFVTIAVMHFMPQLRKRMGLSEAISLDTIMDEHFHLQKEIRHYSTVDYNHALRTSNVAMHLAAGIGADEKLARAGGFYYRMGKLEGEPFIENGVRLARQNCFSERLVSILEEYNGKKRLPSSIESAIVQISDMIVTKFELLDHDTLSTTWNRDIVIYQTMNEKSAEGLYDNSGLSMNQFLAIRELLIKEEMTF
jgi:hypothetical protein